MTLIDRTVSLGDMKIAATQSDGAGPALVLLHGSGASRRVFEEQMQSDLADRFKLVAIDLPGHGDSSDAASPEADYTLPGLATIVIEALEQMDVRRFVLFGWSLGGHIALEMMSRHRGIMGTMISGTPPIGHGPFGVLRAFRITFDSMLASKDRFTEVDVSRFARMCFGDRANVTDLNSIRRADGRLRKVMFSSMMRGACADERRLVETSLVPLAVVVGDQDPFFRMAYLEGIDYCALWEGQCHVIPHYGHDLFRAAPALFNPLLMRFATLASEPRQATLDHRDTDGFEPKQPRRPPAHG